MPTLESTLLLCKEAHGRFNGMDKTGKTPYYWHLLRVMLRLQTNDIELMQIALLHDVVEDTDITLTNLKELGYSDRVIEAVKWSSKNLYDGSFAQWMTDIGKHAPDDTILLKIADISDNLGFERMKGLKSSARLSFKNRNVKTKSNTKILLRDKINKKVMYKMKLFGEMGVYDRYYKGWNLMFSNSENDRTHLIKNVFTGDFCHLNQLKELSNFIPQEEMLQYLSINDINTWKISGELKIIQDRIGQDYLAVVIRPDITSYYINFLSTKIEDNFIHNQQKRDKNTYHITVLNSMEFNYLKEKDSEQFNLKLNEYINQFYDFFTYGIGTAKKNENQTFFVISENETLNLFREKFSLGRKDFHITLGFDKKDVFNLPKDKSSVIYTNNDLWKSFIYQFNNSNYFENEKKLIAQNKLKLK